MTKILNLAFPHVNGDASKLNFAERFSIEMKLMEMSRNGTDLSRTWDNNVVGKFPLQVVMMINNLTGRICALKTAGGKSAVFTLVFGDLAMRGKLNESVGELMTDTAPEIQKYVSKDYQPLAKALGFRYVNGAEYYEARNFEGLARIYEKDSRTVVVYDSHSRGFVELEARARNPFGLHELLNNVSARGVDEADVPALSRLAFVMSQGENFASKEAVNRTSGLLDVLLARLGIGEVDLGRLDPQGRGILEGKDSYRSKAEFEEQKLRESEKEFFTVGDNGDIELSRGLMKAIQGERGNGEALYTKQEVQNALRGLRDSIHGQFAKVNKDSGEIEMFNEAGTAQPGVVDGSITFCISMVLLKMRALNARGESHSLSEGRIKISNSDAEATLALIFKRSGAGEPVLNFGGSATMDVAKDIARVIFNASVKLVESSELRSSYFANESDWNEDSLATNFEEITRELRSQYSLAYVSTNHARDGTFRKISIRPLAKDLSARAKSAEPPCRGGT